MAAALQKLLRHRRWSLSTAIYALQCSPQPHQLPALSILNPDAGQSGLLRQLLGRPPLPTTTATGGSGYLQPTATPIFPSFPLGLWSDPMYVSEPDEAEAEADGTVWADSVKKKRKKKMNKHKYKKLRKRLRRKT